MDPFEPWRSSLPMASGLRQKRAAKPGESFEMREHPSPPRRPLIAQAAQNIRRLFTSITRLKRKVSLPQPTVPPKQRPWSTTLPMLPQESRNANEP